MELSVGQRLSRGEPAERNILELTWKLALQFDGGAKQHPVRDTLQAGKALHVAASALDCPPNGFASSANRRDHADAGDYNAVVQGV
jgi:hypothetical protein